MRKGTKLVLAAFTIWPIVYIVLFMCMGILMGIWECAGARHAGPDYFFEVILPLHFFTMIDGFTLMVIYIMHLFKTDRVRQDKKALWAAVLLLGHMIAMPVYWYWYVWREPEEEIVQAGS